MHVFLSGVFLVGLLTAMLTILHLGLRRLSAPKHLAIAGMVFLVTWTFQFDTELVLQRAGYCIAMPHWPPFTGSLVKLPSWFMTTADLLALVSLPIVIISIVRFARAKVWKRTVQY